MGMLDWRHINKWQTGLLFILAAIILAPPHSTWTPYYPTATPSYTPVLTSLIPLQLPCQHPTLSPVSIVPNQDCRYATSPLHLATLSDSSVRVYFVLVVCLLFPVDLTTGLLLSFNYIESLKLSFCLPRHQYLSLTLVSLHCQLCGVCMWNEWVIQGIIQISLVFQSGRFSIKCDAHIQTFYTPRTRHVRKVFN